MGSLEKYIKMRPLQTWTPTTGIPILGARAKLFAAEFLPDEQALLYRNVLKHRSETMSPEVGPHEGGNKSQHIVAGISFGDGETIIKANSSLSHAETSVLTEFVARRKSDGVHAREQLPRLTRIVLVGHAKGEELRDEGVPLARRATRRGLLRNDIPRATPFPCGECKRSMMAYCDAIGQDPATVEVLVRTTTGEIVRTNLRALDPLPWESEKSPDGHHESFLDYLAKYTKTNEGGNGK